MLLQDIDTKPVSHMTDADLLKHINSLPAFAGAGLVAEYIKRKEKRPATLTLAGVRGRHAGR